MADETRELDEEPEGSDPRALPTWKKVALALAAVSVLFGFALQAFGGSSDEASTPLAGGQETPGGGSSMTNSFAPTGTTQGPGSGGTSGSNQTGVAAATGEGGAGDWSPFFVKGGFSFFVGFCIGYALRAFFKISAVALGLVFLVLFGLEYGGLVEIDWAAAGGLYDSAIAKLSDEFESFKGFITGSLPSAGLAGLGLYTGFKRTGR